MRDVFDWEPDRVVKWLESPEGEEWSYSHHEVTGSGSMLVTAKDMHGAVTDIFWYALRNDEDKAA